MNCPFIMGKGRIVEIIVDEEIGYVTMSYEEKDDLARNYESEVTLIVSPSTKIQDYQGRRIPFHDLEEGMLIDAKFSSVMTRSIPPQTRAFRIMVLKELPNTIMMIDRVVEADTRYGFLYTGDPSDFSRQTRFTVSDDTIIRDKNGNKIALGDLQPGDTVAIERAVFQTASLPPQTPAYNIWVL